MAIDERIIHTNLQEIVDNGSKSKALDYAVDYARVGLRMTGEDLRVQCLYVVTNITGWRGDQAKRIRKNLHDFIARK